MNLPEDSSPLLRCSNISVAFGSHNVLDTVSMTIMEGEIHAVVGNHGSGKTTLINTISGVVKPNSGELFFGNKLLEKNTPKHAIELGIETLHQEINLMKNMNSYENIFLNRELRSLVFFNNKKKMREKTIEAFRIIDLDINPDIPVMFFNNLSQQLIEIAKVICFPPKLLCVDGISGRLSPEHLEKFHYIISRLRQNGTTILYASDNMDEVYNLASKVSVLNDGQIVDTADLSNIDPHRLVSLTYSSIFSRKKLEKSNLELFYLNNLNRNILASLPVSMMVTNSNHSIILVNNCFLETYGIGQKELYNSHISRTSLFPSSVIAVLDRSLQHFQAVQFENVIIPGKTGEIASDIQGFPFFDENESFLGYIFLFEKKSGATQKERNDMASLRVSINEKNTAVGLAHEINNPLGIVINYLQLIQTSGSMENIRNNAGIIDKELKRIKRIIKNLMEHQTTVPLKPGIVDVNPSIKEITSLLEPDMINKRIHVQNDIPQHYSLHADEDLFKQIVMNLTLNSLEAVKEGDTIVFEQYEKLVEGVPYKGIAVRDSGPGIEKQYLEKIFEPFFTTKSDSESRGIGLSLCREIAEQMNGILDVESAPGSGSVFRLMFPEL